MKNYIENKAYNYAKSNKNLDLTSKYNYDYINIDKCISKDINEITIRSYYKKNCTKSDDPAELRSCSLRSQSC